MRLSVPGKVILMGEHAAVYGRPAVVAAVDLRLTVEAFPRAARSGSEPGGVLLRLPDLGLEEEHAWTAIEAFAERARRAWCAFEAGREPFRASREPSALVRVAVGEALASLPRSASTRLRGTSLELRLRSAIPVGAGLGSSAAAAVGVVAAVRRVAAGLGGAMPAVLDRAAPTGLDREELGTIEAVAFQVERRQHGFPSGIDSGAVLRGGVLFVRGGEDAPDSAATGSASGLQFKHLPQPRWLRRGCVIVDSGTPAQTTGAVVTTVRQRYEENPERVTAILDRLATAAEAFRDALVTDRDREAWAAVAAGHRGLVDLGVVPPPIARRIECIEAAGGVAKISGAGALEGESAGAMICALGGRDVGTIDGLSDLQPVDASIGAAGLRFED